MTDVSIEGGSPYWHGVCRVLAGPHGGAIPRRMSEAQEQWYLARPAEKSHWHGRCVTATGCRIAIAGHIRRMTLVTRHLSHCREFFGYDFVTPEGFRETRRVHSPREENFFEVKFPEETSAVTVLLPYQAEVEVVSCQVDSEDGIAPVTFSGEGILFFGDSITQGWEAIAPLDTYAAQVAGGLGRDYRNLSVGGTIMDGENIAFAAEHPWRQAFLAFGVNDAAWRVPVGEFALQAEKAIGLLSSRPESRVTVIAPIWWPGAEEDGGLELLRANRRTLQDLCAAVPHAEYIDGRELIPADRSFFADNVHPNEKGMACMAKNLLKKLPR